MSNYREKRQDGFAPRGNRERASFNPNFSGDNRLKQRSPRPGRNAEERPQYSRANREDNNRGYGRYKSFDNQNRDFDGNRYGSGRGSYGRPNGEFRKDDNFRKGGFRNASAENVQENYGADRRGTYGNRGNRKGAYDPNAKYSTKKRAAYREAKLDPNAPLRLNKFLANAGICSRREADNYIEAGLVTVNGVVVTELGTKVSPNDDVRFNNERINPERKVYVLLNKPKDCVTTVDDPQERKTVLDCLRGVGKERIYPVGRLDRNTTGVLLLTNDGDMAAKLTHPKLDRKSTRLNSSH